jgi:hypothetical protein
MMGIDLIRWVLSSVTFLSFVLPIEDIVTEIEDESSRVRANAQGPSLFLLPPLFHQLYTDLGTTLAEHVELLQCHPNYVIHYHDGEKVTLSSDRAQLREEVEKWEGPGGGDQLDAFLAYVSPLLDRRLSRRDGEGREGLTE